MSVVSFPWLKSFATQSSKVAAGLVAPELDRYTLRSIGRDILVDTNGNNPHILCPQCAGHPRLDEHEDHEWAKEDEKNPDVKWCWPCSRQGKFKVPSLGSYQRWCMTWVLYRVQQGKVSQIPVVADSEKKHCRAMSRYEGDYFHQMYMFWHNVVSNLSRIMDGGMDSHAIVGAAKRQLANHNRGDLYEQMKNAGFKSEYVDILQSWVTA